jgi:carbamoyl-phosphate synthase large subunit
MAKKLNILLTSAGRRVELVRAFRQACKDLNVHGEVVAVDCSELAPALYAASKSYIVPRLKDPDYVPALLRVCKQHQIDAIFPLIDHDIPILSSNRAAFESMGAKVAVVNPDKVAIVRDKYKTADFFRGLGLRTPESWGAHNFPKGLKFPVFIKPLDGSSSKYTFKVENQSQLDFFLTYVPDPIVQEFVDGPEITIDVLNNLDAQFVAAVARKRIEVRSGEVLKGVTLFDERIHRDCKKIAEALSAPGPITVQCMMRGDLPYYTEINARFGGGAPLGIAAGVNYPSIIVSELCKLRFETPLPGQYETGLCVSRFDDAVFISEQERAEMASRHI